MVLLTATAHVCRANCVSDCDWDPSLSYGNLGQPVRQSGRAVSVSVEIEIEQIKKLLTLSSLLDCASKAKSMLFSSFSMFHPPQIRMFDIEYCLYLEYLTTATGS